jgi:ubiquinone/menaquinone biosynthesis C-methylase UbiE
MADETRTIAWADGAAYEKFMGQWSRLAGKIFLDWLAPERGLKWLDVGCGTGAFAETIQANCAPVEIIGIDPSESQILYARTHSTATIVRFEVADARSMPFDENRFDIAVSALVINFIPDREKAIAEMHRVVRPGGTVAVYVWDFAGRSGVNQHINAAAAELEGSGYTPAALNNESTNQDKLKNLFESGGLSKVATRAIEIGVKFRDFDDYWHSNTGFASPIGTLVKNLSEEKRQRLIELVKTKLPIASNGNISYTARVNAVKGVV